MWPGSWHDHGLHLWVGAALSTAGPLHEKCQGKGSMGQSRDEMPCSRSPFSVQPGLLRVAPVCITKQLGACCLPASFMLFDSSSPQSSQT